LRSVVSASGLHFLKVYKAILSCSVIQSFPRLTGNQIVSDPANIHLGLSVSQTDASRSDPHPIVREEGRRSSAQYSIYSVLFVCNTRVRGSSEIAV